MVNFDKFLASFITEMKKYSPITSYNIPGCIKKALEDQGLEYKNGEIVKNQDRIAAEAKETGYGEDEKIRKELIKVFSNKEKYLIDQSFGDITVSEVLAWLEKQGEQKEYIFKPIPRLLDMIEPSDRAKAYCQKLIDTLAKEGYNTDAKIVEGVLKGWNGEEVPMAVMDEQKPAEWKQENREELTEFENAMMHIGGSFFGENAGLDPNDTDIIKEQAELLLELAPKTEWSEEDERIYQSIIDDTVQENQLDDKQINWLKLLKQRYTWKPSDEQLYILNWLANVKLGDSVVEQEVSKHLNELYEDLKKL